MVKQFQKTEEDFICENCGAEVKGNGYTNHCPNCLWCKHVDINPGDRLSPCKGMMEPISVQMKNGQNIILHKCQKCGFERKNKMVKGDNFDQLIEISNS